MDHFIYDREDVILDFTDPDGRVRPAAAAFQRRYLHGPAVDQVLAQDNGAGSVQWHLTDQLGTVRDLVNNAGQVVNHFVYDSFGNLISENTAGPDSRYLFTGREFDPSVDLYYYRARTYDAAIGRFLSEDPIRYAAGDANLYRYVGNDPVANVDPNGENIIAVIGGGAVVVVIGCLFFECPSVVDFVVGLAPGGATLNEISNNAPGVVQGAGGLVGEDARKKAAELDRLRIELGCSP